MIHEISQHLKSLLQRFPDDDSIIFNNQSYKISKDQFATIFPNETELTFVDGGQTEILSAANFCLSFIRVAAVTFPQRTTVKKEFYLLTTARSVNNEIIYVSKIFGDQFIDENDLQISSTDSSIKIGQERAPISKVANIARRFAELSLASLHANSILDGTLEQTFNNEYKYHSNFSALAKSSSLFTASGNSPMILLNKLGPEGCWNYELTEKTSFVKLQENSKHIFRFEGNKQLLSSLVKNSTDALFLGYPYGLVLADQLARVSNSEKRSLRAQFLLNKNNQEIIQYLSTTNAHSILDNLTF